MIIVKIQVAILIMFSSFINEMLVHGSNGEGH